MVPGPKNQSSVSPVGHFHFILFQAKCNMHAFFLFLSLPFPHYIYLPFQGYTIMLNCTHSKYSSALNMSFKNINMKSFFVCTQNTQLSSSANCSFGFRSLQGIIALNAFSYTNKHQCGFLWILHSNFIHSFYSRQDEQENGNNRQFYLLVSEEKHIILLRAIHDSSHMKLNGIV